MNLREQIAVGTTPEVVTAGRAVGMPSFIAATVQASEVEELFTACMPRLAKTVRRLLRNTEDSEDVLQETLLSAFKNLHQFEGRSKFSTWLHSIVRNKAKMHLRRSGAHRCYSLEEVTNEQGELLLDVTPAVDPDAEEICLGKERSEILRRILLRLSPGHRLVIQLCDIEGLEGRAAAARLGLTISGLKTRLHRARKSVNRKLAESLPPEHGRRESATQVGLRKVAKKLRSTPEPAGAPVPVATASWAEHQRDKVESTPTIGTSLGIVKRRRVVGVRHDRATRRRGYCGVPVERGAVDCNVSSAV